MTTGTEGVGEGGRHSWPRRALTPDAAAGGLHDHRLLMRVRRIEPFSPSHRNDSFLGRASWLSGMGTISWPVSSPGAAAYVIGAVRVEPASAETDQAGQRLIATLRSLASPELILPATRTCS
jgi:hypothetical protein